jgi:CubicO group peptidase (beta-lactamase class C family)
MRRQFRVLYRDFLFRIVDRDLLSPHATGDASQLLLQLVTLLAGLSVCFSVPVLAMDPTVPLQAQLMFAWSVEHFLIATTMLVVGIFSVLSWDSMFPGHRDVLVLGPLPIRAHTILLAKLAAIVTALGLAVVTLHVVSGVVWPLALNASARGHAVGALALTMDQAIPPVAAADLQLALDRDLADAVRNGPLAPGAGGGVAIGVYQGGVRRVFAYGAASTNSVFPIASVTKPFTGLVLATMVQEQVVRLDEPVRVLIPAARLPAPIGREITLLDLATHRSGLPGMPATFHPRNPANPFADFDVSKLYAYLARRGVGRPPVSRFTYSNLGFGLLGHALTTRAGVDYATLVGEAITRPLGMDDTVVGLSPEQRGRLLQGYNEDRQLVPEWDIDVLAGAGALRSTAPDMLTWLEANLHPERVRSGTLSAALISSQQVRSNLGSDVGIALDWIVNTESGDFQHGGAMAGFTADAFFNPRRDAAAIVLSNVGPGTWVSADVLGEHIRARLSGEPAVSIAEVAIPAGGGVRSGLRLLVAYWATMLAAGVFIFGLAMGVQGLAASLLPRRHFLRVSSLLQLGAFCLLVGAYLLQSFVVRPGPILTAQQGGMLSSSPSYWFLGLFQELNGSSALEPLADRAWAGLGLAVLGTAIAYALSYFRTLRRIAEQPDITPSVTRGGWLPAFGDGPQTALVQFSLRTLFRSAPHRVILAFYWGLGFAVAMIFLKTPRGQQLAEVSVAGAWHETSVPLLLSSIVMAGFAALAARLAFAMPRDLRANWIFRIVPVRGGSRYVAARRRALVVVSAAPVCTASALVFFWLWPWQPALGHIIALSLLSMIFVELSLSGTQKIPFTCSYLPGRSHAHLVIPVALVVLLPATIGAAGFERDALQDPVAYTGMLGVLSIAWAGVRWRNARVGSVTGAPPEFEDAPADRLMSLELWDARFSEGTGLTPTGPASRAQSRREM